MESIYLKIDGTNESYECELIHFHMNKLNFELVLFKCDLTPIIFLIDTVTMTTKVPKLNLVFEPKLSFLELEKLLMMMMFYSACHWP